MAFMGSCFAGASATSHDFLSLSMSISSGVGALRGAGGGCLLEPFCVSVLAYVSVCPGIARRLLTLPDGTADVKPGGSGTELFFGFGSAGVA